MAKLGEIFQCPSCGNCVMVIKEGSSPEVGCCHSVMTRKRLTLR